MITLRTQVLRCHAIFSIRFVAVLCIILVLPTISLGVTVTHYDKPPEANQAPPGTTVHKHKLSNLTLAERQKRLLPYINFYLSQNLNHPNSNEHYPTEERYHIIGSTKMNYQPVQTKYSELIGSSYQPNKVYNTPQIIYQPKTKFTPFLESNALPGPFIPMTSSQPQKIKVSYAPLEQNEKIPNYSAIYDKLSQLKFQQSVLDSNAGYKNTHNAPPQYILTRKPPIFIPVQEFQQQQADFTSIQSPKTFLHTYTPTSIEVPPNVNIKYEQQDYGGREQIPIKTNLQTESKEQLQDEIMLTQEPIRITQINNPKHFQEQTLTNGEHIKLTPQQNYVPVTAINPQTHYLVQEQKPYHTQNHKQYLQEVVPNNKPIILFSQKVLPQKQYVDVEIPKQEQPIKYVEIPKQEQQIKYVDIPKQEQQIKITKPIIILRPTNTQIKHYAPQPVITENYQPTTTIQRLPEPAVTPVPDIQTENPNSLSLILKKLQESNTLPQTLTPDNIDNSIKTLVHILSSLKKQQNLARPIVVADEEADYEEDEEDNETGVGLGGSRDETPGTITEFFPAHTPEGGTPGTPGVDYPALSSIPQTKFNCKTQRYKGFFADPDTHCQVWHYCDLNGGQASFLCPNGTIFSQVALTCDWWFNVKCSTTTQLYVLNERLYKYIIPLTPKFPEDYTGPLVDRYLALKFREMEEKMKKEKSEKKQKEDKNDEVDELQLLEDKNTERSSYTTKPEDHEVDEDDEDEEKSDFKFQRQRAAL